MPRDGGRAVWRMPLLPEMEELIRACGRRSEEHRGASRIDQRRALPAALRGEVPWAHLYIAGPASIDKERGYNARGGTGAGVRLLAEWIRRRGSAASPARIRTTRASRR